MSKHDDDKKALWALLVLVMIPFSIALSAAVLSQLWWWFIVPAFHAPALSVGNAAGLGCMARLFTSPCDCEKPERDLSEKVSTALGGWFLSPLVVLLIGWVIHSLAR